MNLVIVIYTVLKKLLLYIDVMWTDAMMPCASGSSREQRQGRVS